MRLPAAAILLALIALAGPAPSSAASRVLPGLAFRVLRTPHFRIYYHQGLEQRARTLGEIAESVRATVPVRLGLPAPPLMHVLIVDQDDSANGWATPLPYDTVMVTAAWPAPSEIIGNTRAWLRLVFTHEFTHVLQLQQSRGWARAVRAVFGRAPLAFPNLFLPDWATEGLATFAESRETGEGRLRAGDSFTIVADRVREAGPERMDQVTGGQVEWPGGVGPYLYGGFFTDYLARRFGERKLGELARRTAGRLPFLASRAYRDVFGTGLGALWADYQRSLAALPALSSAVTPRRLTEEGYYVSTPRYAADGSRIVYGRRNPDDFPALAVLPAPRPKPDGSERGARALPLRGRHLAIRYGGEQLSVRGRLVFFDRADYETNVAWRSDLYAADLETGHVQRLTRGARLVGPDVSPDGRSLAAIDLAGGRRELVILRLEGDAAGRLAVSPPSPVRGAAGAVCGSPRWSPDGARIAAERRREGGSSEIVTIDPASGATTVVASSSTGRNLAPAWLPGGRSLVFSSDSEGASFQLYVVPVDSGGATPLAQVPGGAMSPEVSPDGRRLLYVGYTAAGYDLFELDLDALGGVQPQAARAPAGAVLGRDASVAAAPADVNPDAASLPVPVPAATAHDAPYRPFFTLLPRSWEPAADFSGNDLRLGVSTGGVDVLGRHAFGITALWRLQAGSDGMNGPHRVRPDWSAFYVYDRWRPGFFVAASDETSFLPQYVAGVRRASAELRERSVAFGVSVPFAGVLRRQVWQAAFNVERNTLATRGGDRRFVRNALQAGWSYASEHLFGYAIGPEQGIAAGITSEQVRSAFGADGDADAFTGELRGYLRLGGRHAVLAARAALGAASGDRGVARMFYLGGPQAAAGLIDFGSSALPLLRGFEDKAFVGSHVAAANVEYRFPIWRMERGKGNWPLFLRALHGSVFADAGRTWDGRFAWRGWNSSVGAELSIDTVVGFGLPVTLAAGVARPVEAGRARGTAGYVRIGRAF